ncbi:MAG: ORF6N domain-containing protein [Candidatus Brocadiaceae bacterium]|nr:ORF6N domain-containing protein [Candidatus Brocadiaceae bacterium]
MKKQKDTKSTLIPQEYVESKILLIRDKKVMLDRDLALLYGVETKVFNQAVKRNMGRFPEDFMFQLTKDEYDSLRSQIVTSKSGGRRYLPYAFTEHGILMLSSTLNSKKAIQVNVQIMRTFIKLREMMLSYKDLQKKIEAMERRHDKHDEHFQLVFKTIKEMLNPQIKKKGKIGFK